MSRRESPTSAGDANRDTSTDRGSRDSEADFGKNIGQSEKLSDPRHRRDLDDTERIGREGFERGSSSGSSSSGDSSSGSSSSE